MREKNGKFILFIRFNTINIALFILIFGIVFTVNFMDFKHKFTSSFIHDTCEQMSSNFFLYLMSSEIGQLKAVVVADEENIPPISIPRILFTSMTNIWTDDIRTFLGRELPGFSSYHTEIAVAGSGTNLTNLPVESAPPLEVLLKEIEESEKELSPKPDSNSDQESTTPIPKTGGNTVFIYQSHSWEAFIPLLNGVNNPNEAVSINENKNVIVVGKRLQEELIKRGIGTSQSTANATEELQKRIGIIIILTNYQED